MKKIKLSAFLTIILLSFFSFTACAFKPTNVSTNDVFTQDLYKEIIRIDYYVADTPVSVTDKDKMQKIYECLSSLVLTKVDSSAEERYGHTAVDIITDSKTVRIGLLSGEIVVGGIRYWVDKDITEQIKNIAM